MLKLPYEELDYIYEGLEPPFEKATGPVFNRTPRELLENDKYLLMLTNSMRSTLAVLVGSSDGDYTTAIIYMKNSLVTDATTGVVYISKKDFNVNHVLSDNNWWEVYDQSGVSIGEGTALATPVLNSVSTAEVGDNVTITIDNPSANVLYYEWEIAGTYTLVSGNLTGSNSTSIVLRKDVSGTIGVQVTAIGDGVDYENSTTSVMKTVNIAANTLAVPNVSGPTSVNVDVDNVYTITNHDENTVEYEWVVTGNYTLTSGSLTGSNANSITLQVDDGSAVTISVRAIGDGSVYSTSGYSVVKTISANSSVLNTPTVNADSTAVTLGDTISLSITELDGNYSSVTWDITGDFTVVSGNLTGSTSTSINIAPNTTGTIGARARVEGDGVTYDDSLYSDAINIVVTNAAAEYDTTINTGGGYMDGVTYTDPNNIGVLNFNGKAFDNSVPALIMFGTIDGQMFKLDYASEYNGDMFQIVKNDVSYTGTFQEADSSNPVTISQG